MSEDKLRLELQTIQTIQMTQMTQTTQILLDQILTQTDLMTRMIQTIRISLITQENPKINTQMQDEVMAAKAILTKILAILQDTTEEVTNGVD